MKLLTAFRTVALAMVFLVSVPTAFATGTTTPKAPDFAYPKTVATNAEKHLTQGLASGDDSEILRSLIDLTIAKGMISADNLPAILDQAAAISAKRRGTIAGALVNLLRAQLYNDIYQADSWTYNERPSVTGPLPADYKLWSGKQFQNRISELCDSVLLDASILQSTPITAYPNIIETSAQQRIYFPTLYDFAVYRIIDIYSTYEEIPMVEPTKRLYGDLIDAHPDDDAPRLLAIANLYEYLLFNGYNDEATTKADIIELKKIYKANSQSPYSGVILSVLYDVSNRNMILSEKDMVALLREFIKKHPSYDGLECIQNNINNILAPSVGAAAPEMVAPGKPFKIEISCQNASNVTVSIYKIDSKTARELRNSFIPDGTGKQLIKTINIEFSREMPFKADTTVECTLPDFGVYAFKVSTPVPDNYNLSNSSLSIIRVSDIVIGGVTSQNSEVYVVNGASGIPVQDAVINYWNTSRRTIKFDNIGTTDKNGFFTLPASILEQNWIYVSPERGKDVYSGPIGIGSKSRWDPKDKVRGTLYTDLPLYHQGDTVKWSAVTYLAKKTGMEVLTDQSIRVVLRNANYQSIDTIDAVTDNWGRATGHFVLPTGQLTGQYTLLLIPVLPIGTNSPSVEKFSCSFTVSDYKLPTFDVTVTSVARNTPEKGSFTVNGIVRTFSGVGLANATITADFSATRRQRIYDQESIYTDSTTTDNAGQFSIVLPASAGSDFAKDIWSYMVAVSATSISGETQTASKTFYEGTSYVISGSIPDDINAEKPQKISVNVTDPECKPVVRDVKVTFKSDSVEKFSGVYPSDEIAIPWTRIPSGTYDVTVSGIDIEADTLRDVLIVYRTSDKKSPVNIRIWMPKSNVTTQADKRNFTLYYATQSDDTYVLYCLSSADSIMERRWIKAQSGMNTLKVTLPDDIDNAKVQLLSVYDYRTSEANTYLKVTHPDSEFAIDAESFRDKLMPGAMETWTFRTRKGSRSQESALMLTMYNDAINSLAYTPSSIKFTPQGLVNYNNVTYNNPHLGQGYSKVEGYVKYRPDCTVRVPDFNTYGYPLFEGGRVLYKYSEPSMASMPQMMRKSKANGVMMNAAFDDAEIAEEEAADTGGAEEPRVMPTASATVGGDAKEQPFEYRDAFTPLAFFRPMLQTDADGRLSFTFKVPNANARWYFQAMAYDKSLSTAYKMSQVVANKPLMVQPNLPRFLRHGDRASVETLVINNSDDNAKITVSTELFDPATGAVISRGDTIISVDANAQAKVSTALAAPLNASLLGFRVKASDGKFTDGEQSYLPILASVTPVIDTYPFYIPTDSTRFEMPLPAIPDSSRVTLQYCDNPIWYVVTALPGLTEAGYNSAPAAAAALFSASAASGLLKKYPQIGEGLREWVAGDGSDSTLVSMLERNSDLKTLLLEATPWIQDANSDTERMQRLALLLDRKQIDASIHQAVETLSKLHVSGQGWRWIGRYERPSMWATSSTLSILGRLRALGFMPDNKTLTTMVNQSMRWYEKQTEEQYRKYPDGTYREYVELCSLWPDFKQSQIGKSLTAKYVQRTVSGWKKLSLSEKPHAAMLLKQYGYPRVAKQIMESVMEFAESTPQKGMYWPSVNERNGDTMEQLSMAASAMSALSAIMGEGSRQSVDAIAQWLLLQKETRNWGTSAIATEVIARIVQATSGWLTNASTPAIALGGEPIAATPAESKLGYIRTDLSGMAPSDKVLTIDSCGLYPSWGAIFVQAIRPMLEVKASGCEEIAIEKDIYVSRGDELLKPDTIRVGDRLTVQLTLRVTRDMEYVAIVDDRSAAMEPVDQLPGTIWSEGLCFYRESLDSSTRLFIDRLPQGTYLLRYDVWVNNAGEFTTGIAAAQSQYAPSMSAHSGGSIIKVAR